MVTQFLTQKDKEYLFLSNFIVSWEIISEWKRQEISFPGIEKREEKNGKPTEKGYKMVLADKQNSYYFKWMCF